MRDALRQLLGRVVISPQDGAGGMLVFTQRHLDALRDIVDVNYVARAVEGLRTESAE